MATINIANSKGRDAVVGAQSVVKPVKVRWLDEQGRQIQSSRVLKSNISHDLAALEAQAGGRDKVAQLLIEGDPEIDMEVPLAVVGIVPCKVTAQNGPIREGDLLVTSSRAGYAMKGVDRRRMLGAVVGKALEPLDKGDGVIQVLVTLQ